MAKRRQAQFDSPYSPITISHSYSTPGTYNAGASVTDASGTSGQTISVVTVSGAVPLQATAGDPVEVAAGTSVTLDGSGSEPAASITGYSWAFGDGTSGTGESIQHTYTNPGTYTATLTVTTGTQQATAQTTVTVVSAPSPSVGLTVTVTNGATPLAGATLAVITADGTRYPATTDGSGQGVISGLPDGSYTVYAYASGYQPGTTLATQTGGVGAVTIALQPGPVAQTSATSTVLDIQQIEAAGLNPNDPANQNVVQFDIYLSFNPPTGSPQQVQVSGDTTGTVLWDPVITGAEGPSGGSSCPTTEVCFEAPGGYQVTGQAIESQGQPAMLWMIIPGKAQWLKEFFKVTMIVTNLAPSGFNFDNGSITIGPLPNGLSIAPTNPPQTSTQTVSDIASGSSASLSWILRGDDEGFYSVTGTYNGTLDPVGATLSLPISTQPGAIHVWGGSAIHLIVSADSQATTGYPYVVDIGMNDVADVPVYDPGITLLTQGRLNYIYEPDEQLSQSTGEIDPGQTFWTTYRLVPEIAGTLNVGQSFVEDVAGNVEVASTIESHPAVPIDEVPTLTATSEANGVQLSWQAPSVTGIRSYQIFYTPTRNTLFGPTPLKTVSASTLSALIPNGPAGFYAVDTVVNGVPTMFNPLASVGSSTPAGTVNVYTTTSRASVMVPGSPLPIHTVKASKSTIPLTIDLGHKDQPIDGFGAMLTDSAAEELTSLPADQFQQRNDESFRTYSQCRHLRPSHTYWCK